MDFKVCGPIQVTNKTWTKLQIWDTFAPQREELMNISRSYYRGAHGFIIVCDVTNKDTFDNIKFWMQEIKEYGNVEMNKTVLIVGNKIDSYGNRVSNQIQMLISGYIRKYAMKLYDLIFPAYLIDICMEYWPGVSYNEAKSYADKYGVEYVETSCKTGENVDKVFHILSKDISKSMNWLQTPSQEQNTKEEPKGKLQDCALL